MNQDGVQEVLLAMGMHRSGTSALTGMLNCVGVQLGRKLYPPQPEVNEKGFFEHSAIADLNDRILYTLGSCWDDILPLPPGWEDNSALHPLRERLKRIIRDDFRTAKLWSLKDPRICRLLPFWQRLLAEIGVTSRYILIVRHPMEVAGSLVRRDDFSLEKALLLWLEHNLEAEFHTRRSPRLVVSFYDMLEDPVGQLKQMQSELRLHFPIDLPQAERTISEFIAPELRHQRPQPFPADSELASMAAQAFAILEAAARGGKVNSAVMDAIRIRFINYRDGFPPILTEQLRSVGRQRGEAQVMVDRIFSSWSWHLGKPWRFLERLTGGDI